MNFYCAAAMGLSFSVLLSCKSRSYNAPDLKSTKSEEVFKIDAGAYNAFVLWRDYAGYPLKALTKLPADFEYSAAQNVPHEIDEVFVTPYPNATKGVKVENDVLIYPEKNPNGKSVDFKLKFFTERQFEGIEKGHVYAARECSEKGKRLPTAQELLDFCIASKPLGDSSRCYFGAIDDIWSVSISHEDSRRAWFWSGDEEVLQYDKRDPLGRTEHQIICVGKVQ